MPSYLYYLIATLILVLTLFIFLILSLKISEKKDLQISMWIVAPVLIVLLILFSWLFFEFIQDRKLALISLSPLIGSVLGIILGVSYYKTKIKNKHNKGKRLL